MTSVNLASAQLAQLLQAHRLPLASLGAFIFPVPPYFLEAATFAGQQQVPHARAPPPLWPISRTGSPYGIASTLPLFRRARPFFFLRWRFSVNKSRSLFL